MHSAELYAVLNAIHYSSRSSMGRMLILAVSLTALSSLVDCLSRSVKSYSLFESAHFLDGLMDGGRVIEFWWFASGLFYSVQFALSYIDLLDSVGFDYNAWSGLFWPYGEVEVPPTRGIFFECHLSLPVVEVLAKHLGCSDCLP